MTDDEVRYCVTRDGVRIAYSVWGEGEPVVHVIGYPFSHLTASLRIDSLRRYYETIAARAKLIRLDVRGCGLSQRDVVLDWANEFASMALDVEAVLDKLDIGEASLIGYGSGTGTCGLFAARHPERVRRLVIWDGTARPDALQARGNAVLALANADWDLFCRTAASTTFGWESSADIERMAAFIQSSIDAENFKRWLPDMLSAQFVAPLEEVRAPVFVLHHESSFFVTHDASAEIAARVPNSSLVELEGTWITTNARAERVANIILDFFQIPKRGSASPATTRGSEDGSAAPVSIVFTDVEQNTALLDRIGDDAWRRELREYERLTREQLRANGGTEVKTIGDAFMASFASAAQALSCAVAMQREFAARNESAEHPLRVRIGINAGEPIAEGGDLFGTSVTIASRISTLAAGGEILASNVVRELVAGKGFLFADRGEHVLRGFEDPVKVYEVQWRP
jgi:class 3 adenylate cyclase/alpha-beta hydrolase superfamily lysophospholipase